MSQKAKETVEKTAFRVKEVANKAFLGESTLTVGEAICTVIGLAVIGYSFWKLEGNKKKYGCGAGLAVIILGEFLF